MNYYELLEVSPKASADVIKTAYKTLAKKYHPDTYEGDRSFAEDKMKLLNEAIAVLSNAEKRKSYDEENSISSEGELSSPKGEDSIFSKPDDINKSYLKDIDKFIANKKAAQEKSTSVKKGEFSVDLRDIDELKAYDEIDIKEQRFNYDKYATDENKKTKVKRRKAEKIGNWYYILISVLVLANVLMVFLIYNSFSFDLLKDFL